MKSASSTEKCARCKGIRHVPVEDGMEGTVMVCPECYGTGEGPDPDDKLDGLEGMDAWNV